MELPEDTLDEIRDYLKGRLSEEQTASFRRRMADDPALEDQVAFGRLMMGGLEQIAASKKARRKRIIKWCIFIVLVLSGIFLLIKFKESNDLNFRPFNQGNSHTASDNDYQIAATQGGGMSDKTSSDRPSGIVWNSANEVIFSGQFIHSAKFGNVEVSGFGGTDIFLAACNRQLDFLWTKRFGSASGDDLCGKIAIDSKDNILMTGRIVNQAIFDGTIVTATGNECSGKADFFIAKFNDTGELQWIDHSGGNCIPDKQTGPNQGIAVTTDIYDNIFATSSYIGTPEIGAVTLPQGGPNEDLYLIKYAPDGRVQWAKGLTGTYMIYAMGVDTDKNGDVYLTGFFGHHNLSGSATFDDVTLKSFGGRDIFTCKYSSEGKLIWASQAGSSLIGGNDLGGSIKSNNPGECYVSGVFEDAANFDNKMLISHGKRDAFLAKYDRKGKLIWAKNFGGIEDDRNNSICIDDEGNVYFTGTFTHQAKFEQQELTSLGEEDIFILKYSPDGHLIWIRQMGGDSDEWNSDSPSDIAINKQGNLVVTGFFSGTMKIGNKTLTSKGREDIFILFFDKNGNVLEAKQVDYEL